MLSKTLVFGALVASAGAFTTGPALPLASTRSAACSRSMVMLNQYPQEAPSGAPPADLFNIWRNDYMMTPKEAEAADQERKENTIFDGVLPPFSQGFNQERGANLKQRTLKGEGPTFLASTANPVSAYEPRPSDYIPRKGILPSEVSGLTPEQVLAAKKKQGMPGKK